jgi:hypothetical protein
LPNAASAASRCAWRTGCSRSVLYISAGTHRGLDKGTETFGAMRPASSSVRPRTITVREHLRVRVAPALAGSSASDLFNDLDGPGGTAASGRRVLPELRAPPLASR